MNRVLLAALGFLVACSGAAKSSTTESARVLAPVRDGGTDGAATEPAPEPVEPWPSTKPGAVWTVVEWKMTDADASSALEQAGLTARPRTDSTNGRVEAIDVTSALNGWKASITFDAGTKQIDTVTVHGDPATIAQAHAERAMIEERFGAPVETHVHWSKQCANDKAIEIEGPSPAWRVTQSLTRQGEEKSAVAWPSMKDVSWGQAVASVVRVMKSAGFVPEKLAPPPPPPKAPKSAKPPAKAPKAPPPKGGKLIEVGFKKDGEHVKVGILEKTGLQSISVGQDVADRKTAERRANDALGSLGSCLSEAETEASSFHDAATNVEVKITGFQGQRVVFESYKKSP